MVVFTTPRKTAAAQRDGQEGDGQQEGRRRYFRSPHRQAGFYPHRTEAKIIIIFLLKFKQFFRIITFWIISPAAHRLS
jgi:hypothetical protein